MGCEYQIIGPDGHQICGDYRTMWYEDGWYCLDHVQAIQFSENEAVFLEIKNWITAIAKENP